MPRRVSSSGIASRRGGKSSAGGRSPVSILLITSCETLAQGSQVLLRQARPGPVIAEFRAEYARRRPGPVGIVRHLIGIPSGKAAPRRQSVGIRADSVSNRSPFRTGCETQTAGQGRDSDHDSRGGGHAPLHRQLPR